jgi:hypothetical protein
MSDIHTVHATKADLLELRIDFHKEFIAQTRWLAGFLIVVFITAITANAAIFGLMLRLALPGTPS